MLKKLKIKKLANHWYPVIKHESGYICGFEKKIDRYLNLISFEQEEFTIEFEELGVICEGINIIYFDENDISRYLTTADFFDLKFVVNDHEFKISSDLYWLLEYNFNFKFHENSYKIHIY